jgi:hypothetical protein
MKTNNLNKITNSGFKTPEKYFESFDDKLFDKLSEKSPLPGTKDTGFKVPDAYFDTIENEILKKIDEQDTPVIKLSSRMNLYYIAGIAASLILLFAVFIGGNDDSEELSVEMVEQYFQSSDLDSYELAELLSDADLLDEDFTIATTPYDESNLEDYLLENVDIETYLE